jgi:hypothetical protein
MKNWWMRIGCSLTGWNPHILDSCTEASRKQLKKYTSAIVILIILWSFIGYSFSDRYVHAPWWGCLITALIFVTIIIQIERQIILTVGKNIGLTIFRLIIAFIMAIIGSVIIDQIIFKDDIEKKMIEIVDRQVIEQIPNRLTVINTKLLEIQHEVDSLDSKNLELYDEISRRPTIETISTLTSPLTIRKSDGSDTIIYRTTVSRNPISNPKVNEAEINRLQLDRLRKQQEEYTKGKIDAEKILREELKLNQGFLEELNAIIEILKERPVALIFYIILFAFLMSLELFVVVSKYGDRKSDYDLVVEHQLEQKIKTLNNLVQ